MSIGKENNSTKKAGTKAFANGYFGQESVTKIVSYNIQSDQKQTCRDQRHDGLFENTSEFIFMQASVIVFDERCPGCSCDYVGIPVCRAVI